MAIVSNPRNIDLDDIQGMVIRGYGSLFYTGYFFLRIDDAVKAKTWIGKIHPQIDSADPKKVSETLHLAFTPSGLTQLGLSKVNLANFSTPFREGMDMENRNRQLGDYGPNLPANWNWGGKKGKDDLHLLLILHAKDEAGLFKLVAEQKALLASNGGLTLSKELLGYSREDQKEPFGFHDGISQPVIKGSGRSGPKNDLVETGEFLFGYKNEYGEYAYSPLITEDQGDTSLLPKDGGGSGFPDLGKNGSFMVYRQIQQHVDRFWDYMLKKTDGEGVSEEAAVRLASKCVGRWPSGASLVEFPEYDPGGNPSNDDFGYAEKDPHGHSCPYGSHLRRNNPRDNFRWYGPDKSLKITRRHRIMRRGRTYMVPKDPAVPFPPEPEGKGSKASGEKPYDEIGLHFICFNTNLELQFEFIQHAWANNNQLRHLTNDVDVIIGVPNENDPHQATNQFTIQAEPVNQFVEELERFVTIKGGEYFFFPGLKAIQYLTTI